ncbi:lytic polysaccharide monooxygenase [Demequina flava]|uniref:lytic polysaccharide monooxygenase n=1 Tax=Demequina flava TaxID=1095025 RepID=UPI00078023A3|nr:lytic polysaccharide monooxygenase [Demequina flava]
MHTMTIAGLVHGRGTRLAMAAILTALLAVIVVPAVTSTPAAAHGWVTSPPSRQDHCAAGTTSFDCGRIAYEPQSVEAPKGSMLCSGGSDFAVLDDESLPWPRTQTGTDVTFQWKLTAAHSTATWEYFVDGELFATYDQGGQQPPSNIQHTLTGLPEGDHTILARWNIADTAMAFYNCVDLTIGEGGPNPTPSPTPTSTGTPTPTPTPTTTGTPVECAPAWNADTVYNGGQTVRYNGSEWSAKWWTQGETPGGQWGPWNNLGECGNPTPPSPTPTPTQTSTPSPTPTQTSSPTATPSPSPTSTGLPTCSTPDYEPGRVYIGGDTVFFASGKWKARWWNQQEPANQTWGPWEFIGQCADPR